MTTRRLPHCLLGWHFLHVFRLPILLICSESVASFRFWCSLCRKWERVAERNQSRTSVRQFAEHAVVVEYCDFNPGDSVAYLRVKCPDDCAVLLEDLRLSRRMLGWLIPEVRVLDPDEEDRYREARQRPRSERPPAKKVRRKCMHLRDSVENPHGIVCLGPVSKCATGLTGL